MGLFGGNKPQETQLTQPPPNVTPVSARKYNISAEAQSYRAKLESSIKMLMPSAGKVDEKMQLSSSVVLIQQNEVIIKYLDDICKKLDKLTEE